MFLSLLISLVCVLLCVGLHMTVLRYLWRYVISKQHIAMRTWRTAGLVVVCFLCHKVEITFFSIGFAAIAPLDNIHWRDLRWAEDGQLEIWYYSASFYTSLGTTNPLNPGFRLLVGLEALTGLILITWTASFLYLVMSRTWEHGTHPALHV